MTAISLNILIRIAALIIFFWSVISIATHYSNNLIFQITTIAMICISGASILRSPSKHVILRNVILGHAVLIAFFWVIVAITTHYSDNIIFQIISIMTGFMKASKTFSNPYFVLSRVMVFTHILLITALTIYYWVVIAIITYFFNNLILQIIAFLGILAISGFVINWILVIELFLAKPLLRWIHRKNQRLK